MRHFTTVCDINYLPQGLALYSSLMKVNPGFTLYWLGINDETVIKLKELNLPNVKINNAGCHFRQSKGFSYKEYCWSLASRYTNYILKQYNMPGIAYLDADLYFYQDYELIYKEIGDKSIGIVEHRIPTYKNVGKYNVGFVYFKNDKPGSTCLKRWSNLVANKDNDYFKDYGFCGDQGYLMLFQKWFNNSVHIIECGHSAWWNSRFYDYEGDYIIWNGKRQLLIYTHYSHFKLTDNGYTHDEMVEMQPRLKQYYDNYAKEVRECQEQIKSI